MEIISTIYYTDQVYIKPTYVRRLDTKNLARSANSIVI